MENKELFLEWCKRINVTASNIVQLHEAGALSDDYQSAYLQAVKDSMNTLEVIIADQN